MARNRKKILSTGNQFKELIEEEKSYNWGTPFDYGQEVTFTTGGFGCDPGKDYTARLIDRVVYKDWEEENKDSKVYHYNGWFSEEIGYLAQKKYKNGWSKPFLFCLKMATNFGGKVLVEKTYKQHKRKEILKKL